MVVMSIVKHAAVEAGVGRAPVEGQLIERASSQRGKAG